MKKSVLMRVLALLMVMTLSISMLAACSGGNGNSSNSGNADQPVTEPAANDDQKEGGPDSAPDDSNDEARGGKILLLSNLTDGAQYDFYIEYLKMACENLGYTFDVVYGDMFNDPAGNLNNVKTAMTSDVVGLIAMQDGGINDILIEYPELYVVGFMTDMASVYDEDGASRAAAGNDHFLGTLADGFQDGADTGKQYFDIVLEKGYKRVSTVIFPFYAYPSLAVADQVFRGMVEEYNATAAEDDQIEIVGEAEVLNFEPISDSYFLEADHQDLDAVLGICAGVSFVYPVLKTAVANGTISSETKLLTSGFENDSDILADFGGDGVIQSIVISSVESILYPLVLLDNAICGNQFSDYSSSECIDAPQYVLKSAEDMNTILENSAFITLDMSKLGLSWEEAKQYFTRYNEAATLSDLQGLLESDQLTEAAFK